MQNNIKEVKKLFTKNGNENDVLVQLLKMRKRNN